MANETGNGNPNMRPDESFEQIENPTSNEEVYRGSLAAILNQNLGVYVECDFLIGTNNIVRKDGVLYAVGNNFVTLYQEADDRYVMCDLYSLKFVTFYPTNPNTGTGPRTARIRTARR